MKTINYKLFLEKTNTNENPIYNFDKAFQKYLDRLDTQKDNDFLEFLWNTRKKGITIKRCLNFCQIYFRLLLDHRNLRDMTEEEFTEVYTEIFCSNLANMTKITHLKAVKQILKYYKVHKRIDFDEFKIKGEQNPIKPEELLTDEEKKIIIKEIKSLKHKVFFTILFNSGLRAGEVFSINRESFQKVENGYLISINKSKTKLRTVFVYENINLIEKLLKTK